MWPLFAACYAIRPTLARPTVAAPIRFQPVNASQPYSRWDQGKARHLPL